MPFVTVENNFDGSWKRIVSEWAAMNGHYVCEFRDLPAWYLENSNTALLSAAAWKCKCPSMCEPKVEKRKLTGRPGRPRKYVGRLDMEIHVDGNWTWIEAKKDHFLLTHKKDGRSERRKRLVNLIENSRKSAEASSKAAKDNGWNTSAIAFFSAGVAANTRERDNDHSLRDGLGKEEAVRRAIDSELKAMMDRLKEYESESGVSLNYAVFRNPEVRLQKWVDIEYPAAFGLIMSAL